MKNIVFFSLIVLTCLACGKTNFFQEGDKSEAKSAVTEDLNIPENSDSLANSGSEELSAEDTKNNPAEAEIVIESGQEGEMDAVAETGNQEEMPNENSEDATVVDEEAESANIALNCSEALSLTDIEAINVVHISSQGNDDIQLTPDSIIVLNLTGNSDIELESDEIEQIKGLCINAAGGSRTSIEIEFKVDEMNYYGRGNASTSLDFDDDGTFDTINIDISGNHDLNIYGEKIDCSLLNKIEAGGGLVHCENFTN